MPQISCNVHIALGFRAPVCALMFLTASVSEVSVKQSNISSNISPNTVRRDVGSFDHRVGSCNIGFVDVGRNLIALKNIG